MLCCVALCLFAFPTVLICYAGALRGCLHSRPPITDLQSQDSGLYTCTASSESGETSWSASLTVRPHILHSMCSTHSCNKTYLSTYAQCVMYTNERVSNYGTVLKRNCTPFPSDRQTHTQNTYLLAPGHCELTQRLQSVHSA